MFEEDHEVKALWQDSVKSEFTFDFGKPWKCTFVFKGGYTQCALKFSEDIKPADIELGKLT